VTTVHEVDLEAVAADHDLALQSDPDPDRVHQNDHVTLVVEAVAARVEAEVALVLEIDLDRKYISF